MNYELTDETIQYDGRTLYRIKALVDIPYHCVAAGDLGGFIEKVENLQGNAWVSGNARVFDNAKVYGDAHVSDDARVFGNAEVYDTAMIFKDAWVFENAQVFGNAAVFGTALVFDDAWVFDEASVHGDASVCDDARVGGDARVFGDEPEVKEDNPYIISDQLLADLKLAACQFEQAERHGLEVLSMGMSGDYYGTPFIKLLQARTALEEAARAYAKQFNPL